MPEAEAVLDRVSEVGLAGYLLYIGSVSHSYISCIPTDL